MEVVSKTEDISQLHTQTLYTPVAYMDITNALFKERETPLAHIALLTSTSPKPCLEPAPSKAILKRYHPTLL